MVGAKLLCKASNPLSHIELPRIAVVIVNYRTPTLTIDCLSSLKSEVEANQGTQVFVVDNNSGDNSNPEINSAIQSNGWSSWVQVLPQDRNGGFSFGNNAAIRPFDTKLPRPEFFWLLNSDTIVRPGALQALLDALDAHPNFGLAGSRLENRDGTGQVSAFRFPGIVSEFLSAMRLGILDRLCSNYLVAPGVCEEQPNEPDWLAGASLLIKREVFEEVGLLDEEYFLYFEEVDFCSRAQKAGWRCLYVPDSRVIHLVGQSSGVTASNAAERRLPSYWFESRRRFFLQKYGKVRYTLANVSWLIGHLCYRTRRCFQARPAKLPERILSDFLKHNLRF